MFAQAGLLSMAKKLMTPKKVSTKKVKSQLRRFFMIVVLIVHQIRDHHKYSFYTVVDVSFSLVWWVHQQPNLGNHLLRNSSLASCCWWAKHKPVPQYQLREND